MKEQQQINKLTQCWADGGGDCNHDLCPQVLENEPETTSRGCPLPLIDHRED
ncbi:hypothetical protein [Aquimarina macrocephali]|uniref:hypothetical protein n=1 Tax=Aquimarina macrocephali TaxID=666563 RepID=UPI003F673B7D